MSGQFLTSNDQTLINMDRLRGFQPRPFASTDNALALDPLEQALITLQARTRDRLERGVVGNNV
jgi:hypothetical protein